jgi:hypothetical protein
MHPIRSFADAAFRGQRRKLLAENINEQRSKRDRSVELFGERDSAAVHDLDCSCKRRVAQVFARRFPWARECIHVCDTVIPRTCRDHYQPFKVRLEQEVLN